MKAGLFLGGQVPGLAGAGKGTIDEPQNVDHHHANVRKFSKCLDLMKMFREMFFSMKTIKMGREGSGTGDSF